MQVPIAMDEWNEMTEEEQAEMLEQYPDSVPDAAKSEQEEKPAKEDEKKEDSPDDDDDTVVYKGKKVPIQNIIGEHIRKAVKEKDKDIEELKMLVSQFTKQPKQPEKSSDYWQKQAEEVAGKLVITDPETGDVKVDPKAVFALMQNTAGIYEEFRNVEKQRDRDVKSALRMLDKDEREIIGDVVEEELAKVPLGQPIDEDTKKRAIAYAKGTRQDKYLERVKAEMEANLSKGKKQIEGEVEEDDAIVPSSGKRSAQGGKRPTARQRQLAAARGIDVELQMLLDEKREKQKKSK